MEIEMDAILEMTFRTLREWAQQVTLQAEDHWKTIYIFGSATSPDSGRFNPRESDIDLLAVFAPSCNLPHQRVLACTGILTHLQDLEKRLRTIGLSSIESKPIVSCGAFTSFELDLGINTSNDPHWLVRNTFLELSPDSAPQPLRFRVIDLPNTSADAVNVLVNCSEYRKRFLSIGPTGRREVNPVRSGDPIFKKVGRTAVRMIGSGSADLTYDPPTGLRHVLRLLDEFNGNIYTEVARKLTSAIEGRPQEIDVEKQLLLWEVLADEAKSRIIAASPELASGVSRQTESVTHGTLALRSIEPHARASQTSQVDARHPSRESVQAFNFYRENRYQLSRIARSYYDEVAHPDYSVVTSRQLLPDSPIPIDAIDAQLQREWIDTEIDLPIPTVAALKGQDYSRLIASVAPHVRQEDNFCYRLINAEPNDQTPQLVFCPSRYSKFVNTCDVLGFELSHWVMRNQEAAVGGDRRPTLGDLPARGRPDAIFDLKNRSACPATSAVLFVLNSSDGDSFYVHRRTSPQLLDSPGGWHVVPSGQFQPDTAEDTNHRRNFSIRRTVFRELAEELLGVQEVENAIRHRADFYLDPRVAPFVEGMARGAVRLYYMGLGFDPLTTKPGFYLALVIDAADMPIESCKFLDNWEGEALAVPCDELEKWAMDPRMIPDGATCLKLALRHIGVLLQP
jgi:predicted nucleotidyltransferase